MLEYLPAAISVFGSLISAAVVLGATRQISKEHERRLNEIDDDQTRQWSHINRTEIALANVKGKLGLNGGK